MALVSAVMTSNPVACRSDTPIGVVAQLMIDNDCGEIPVVDGQGHPIGVVTDRDIVVRLVAAGEETAGAMAGQAMSRPAHTVGENADLRDCLCLMEAEQIRRVPVVDERGRLTGMVALADIARANRDTATAEVMKEVSRPAPDSHRREASTFRHL